MEKFEYGSKEELISVAKTLRKGILDLMTGKRTPDSFQYLYWEFESFLLEHGYDVETDEDHSDETMNKINKHFLKIEGKD